MNMFDSSMLFPKHFTWERLHRVNSYMKLLEKRILRSLSLTVQVLRMLLDRLYDGNIGGR